MIAEPGSYRAADFIPFSREVLQATTAQYNEAVWPVQLVCLAVTGMLTWLAFFPQEPPARRAALGLLGLAWVFTGLVFQLHYFASINPPVRYAGWAFVLQAALIGGAVCVHPLPARPRRTAIMAPAFLLIALLPVELALGDPPGELLLFGWGPGRTALASVFLVSVLPLGKSRLALLPVPIAWLLYSVFIQYALATR